MIEEIWKDIAGFEGLYQVSNLGNIKSLGNDKSKKEKILTPVLCQGYLQVHLYKNRKVKNRQVHRLVAEAFIENPENLPIINHKDEVKTNNSVSNLEWCSYQYNLIYNNKHRRICKKIGCYKERKLIKVYDAVIDVKKDGFNDGNVVSCCKGRLKSTGGFQWKYLD